MPAPPCLFLRTDCGPEPVELAPEDAEHAGRVLRLDVGDEVVGLDGRGGRHPLRVVARGRGELSFERAAAASHEPAAGEPGSPLPWIEVVTSLPRGARAEEMLDRLTQLGVSLVRPLITERTQGFARELSASRMARLQRVARAACKQSRRAWLPEIAAPVEVAALAQLLQTGSACVLSPAADASLLRWTRALARGSRAAPWRVIVGTEGGWTDAEERALVEAGARPASLGPSILRIETAAEAAVSVLVQAAFEAR